MIVYTVKKKVNCMASRRSVQQYRIRRTVSFKYAVGICPKMFHSHCELYLFLAGDVEFIGEKQRCPIPPDTLVHKQGDAASSESIPYFNQEAYRMKIVHESARDVPVVWEGDVCVLGGSATGVFAAVRAARMGAAVAVVERQNCFGGTATAGLVNIWHSLFDFDGREQVIAGLSDEVIRTLVREGQCETSRNRNTANRFNPIALVRLLDKMVQKEGVYPLLHTMYAGVNTDGDRVDCVFVQNKDGRGAIRAKMFVDATGDGDLLRDLGVDRYSNASVQPPTSTFLLSGNTSGQVIEWAITQHGAEFGLDDDWGWFDPVPGLPGISFRADNHVFGFDLSRADDLIRAELEGRRRAFALEALLKKYVSRDYAIVNLASSIGIRETVHYATKWKANADDLLLGKRYEDAILQGTYRVDQHHPDDNGITFKELDGSLDVFYGKGGKRVHGNWRRDMGLDEHYARFYQIPFPVLVLERWRNVIPAGRMVNADEGAFGALRVMINTNQMGEAAGAACALCLDKNIPLQSLDGRQVREALRKGGSAL